jgi:hypothetical protein
MVSSDGREDICPDTAGWTSDQPAVSRKLTQANYGAGGVGLDGVKPGMNNGFTTGTPLLNSE